MNAAAINTVLAWHEALNDGDVDRLVSLSSDDLEVGGPRGSGRGVQLLRDWVARAGIHLEPGHIFGRADTVVVEEQARWRSPETGEFSEPQTVASAFLVRDGRVTSVIRHPDLPSALQAAALDVSDQTSRQ